MGVIPYPPSGRSPGLAPATTGEDRPVAFGLSLDLLLLALLPLWLFLATVIPVIVAAGLGLLDASTLYPALVVSGLFSHAVLLPAGAYQARQKSERQRELSEARLSHFACRVVELYATTRQSPQVAADPRTAQAFRLYALAGAELQENPYNLRQETSQMISHGTSLAERALASSPSPGYGQH